MVSIDHNIGGVDYLGGNVWMISVVPYREDTCISFRLLPSPRGIMSYLIPVKYRSDSGRPSIALDGYEGAE